jgi:D-arabinose 1-dehydrogenase-like Zn-dependent alcohol dehydrogenase
MLCNILCERRYALKVPENLPLVAAAPLLCAGITTYSPLKHYGLDKPGMKLAVVGLGGLGHMAVKFGKVRTVAFQANTHLLVTTSHVLLSRTLDLHVGQVRVLIGVD